MTLVCSLDTCVLLQSTVFSSNSKGKRLLAVNRARLVSGCFSARIHDHAKKTTGVWGSELAWFYATLRCLVSQVLSPTAAHGRNTCR